jgi:hypothetical protein
MYYPTKDNCICCIIVCHVSIQILVPKPDATNDDMNTSRCINIAPIYCGDGGCSGRNSCDLVVLED